MLPARVETSSYDKAGTILYDSTKLPISLYYDNLQNDEIYLSYYFYE